MKKLGLISTFVLSIVMAFTSCDSDNNDIAEEGTLVINEVYTWSPQKEISDLDYIEFYNDTFESIDLSGSKIWEAGGREEAWTFPENSMILSKGRLLIECDKDELKNDTINNPSFGLSKGPDEYIVLADANWNVLDSIACPSLKEFESYGRETDGAEEWVIFAQNTKNTENQGQVRQEVTNAIGLYINEVFTNNQKYDDAIYTWNETVDFVELYNSSNTDIDLTGYTMNDDSLSEAKLFSFVDGTIIPANGYLVLDVYKVKDGDQPEGVPVFGLGKNGDWVFIWNPAGTLLAEIEIPAVDSDQIETVGRITDGSDELVFFSEVSKGESNNGKASHSTTD